MKRRALLGIFRNTAARRFRRWQPFHLEQPADRAKEAIPRHNEIKKYLARSICRNLSVPVPPGN